MPILRVLQVTIAAIVSVVGLFGLYLMFVAEMDTAQNFHEYFKWALGAGLVFLAVGAALIIFDRNDDISTDYEEMVKK